MVGDKAGDVRAGEAAGVKPILVSTGYGAKERCLVAIETPYVKDLLAASVFIARTSSGRNRRLSADGSNY